MDRTEELCSATPGIKRQPRPWYSGETHGLRGFGAHLNNNRREREGKYKKDTQREGESERNYRSIVVGAEKKCPTSSLNGCSKPALINRQLMGNFGNADPSPVGKPSTTSGGSETAQHSQRE